MTTSNNNAEKKQSDISANHNNTTAWVGENEKFFLPPVCNKMMHNDQLKVRVPNSKQTVKILRKQTGELKGPGARATLGHMSIWFGEHQIVVRGSNSEYKLPSHSRSKVLR